MTKRIKFSLSLLSLIMGASFSATAAQGQEPFGKIQVYAGPQSVTPGQTISVTIEKTNLLGGSSHDETVELTYMSDSEFVSLSGKVLQGLVSFDVPAQHRAGRMTFNAISGNLVSNPSSVMVVAAAPISFEFDVEPSRDANVVDLTSAVIRDAFGNPLTDQTLIALDWFDQTGVKQSEFTHLSNGRLAHVSICPSAYTVPLRIRAVLKNVEVFSTELSEFCAGRGEAA
jgi:hypothetical protein